MGKELPDNPLTEIPVKEMGRFFSAVSEPVYREAVKYPFPGAGLKS